MRNLPLCIAVLAGAAVASAAHADVATLGAAHDNTLYQSADGSLSNGAGATLFAGKTAQGATRRGLIQFDLSSLPAGAVITAATLQLNMSQSAGGAADVSLHRALAAWGEGTSDAGPSGGAGAPSTTGDATWLHTFFNSSFWTAQGGDFDPASSATTNVGSVGLYTWSGAALLADIQNWYANPASNDGWVITGNEGASSTAKRFDTRENPTIANRPVLTIQYSVPAPAPAALLGLSVVTLARRRHRVRL